MKVVVGTCLGRCSDYQASTGTYMINGEIHASVTGKRNIDATTTPPSVSVTRDIYASAVPSIGSTVVGIVVRINPRFATVNVLVVGNVACSEGFQGVVRVQDIRATEKDKVTVYKSFRPGDVIRAKVISLGEARSYILTTAENDLGVVFAQSAAGYNMVPVSWEEMVCPKTKIVEHRKCAKP